MTNPFIIAIRQDPERFLSALDTDELKEVAEGCIMMLEAKAKAGDARAPAKLQALYRAVANIEI